MTERQLQLRVGLFVIVAVAAAMAMVFQFGEIAAYWRPTYPLAVYFDSAPGVHPATPVRRSGVSIGKVRSVDFDDRRGGVTITMEIREPVRIRSDAQPRIVRTLLGDSTIEFEPGRSGAFVSPGARMEGTTSPDPMDVVGRMEERLDLALESFVATSQEWQQVGRSVNGLMDTHRGNLDVVIQRAAESLQQFTETMQSAQEVLVHSTVILGDPRNQENLRRTLEALPQMVAETRQTIGAVRSAVQKADENLTNLSSATQPLAERSASIVIRLDNTLANLESVSSELNALTQLAAKEDGSLQQFVTDPSVYRNLNASTASLAVLLQNMEPILRDLRIFSDKIARHPEVMGVGGYMRGSSGLKEPWPAQPVRQSVLPSAAANTQ